MRPSRIVAIVVAALLLGAAAGALYRSWTNPSVEARATDAARKLEGQVDKATR